MENNKQGQVWFWAAALSQTSNSILAFLPFFPPIKIRTQGTVAPCSLCAISALRPSRQKLELWSRKRCWKATPKGPVHTQWVSWLFRMWNRIRIQNLRGKQVKRKKKHVKYWTLWRRAGSRSRNVNVKYCGCWLLTDSGMKCDILWQTHMKCDTSGCPEAC